MPLSHGSTCKASAAGWGFVLSVDCSVDSTPGASFCFRFSVKLGAPAEQCTPGKSVRAGDRDAVPGLLTSQRMASFSSLVKLRRLARPSRAESAAVASVKSRSTADSLAAPLALVLICGRALRMKLRSPINFDLATVDQISPTAHAGPREFRRRGIMRERHPAPVQRLHVHRP
jgi:hypothetical protein